MSYAITTSIRIDAAAEAVWAVLTDFTAYGRWSTFSSVRGAAVVGSRLAMRMPGFSFTATVTAATPDQRLQWAGVLLHERIFRGEHSFILEEGPDGSTEVINREVFSGVLITALGRLVKQHSDTGYARFNVGLKRHVELQHR